MLVSLARRCGAGAGGALAAARRGVATAPQPITVAHGDGIGPEIMEATLEVLKAAGAKIQPEVIEIGEKVYLEGNSSGIAPASWESLRRTKIFLKAPITTPMGGGYKSTSGCGARGCRAHARARACSHRRLICTHAARG